MKIRFKYTQEQVDFLVENYKRMQLKDLVVAFNQKFNTDRKHSHIKNKIKQINLTKRNIKENYGKYTDEMCKWLIEKHNTIKMDKLVEMFNKKFNAKFTKSALWHKIHRLKGADFDRTREYVPRLTWTEEMVDFLKEHYDHYKYSEVAEMLNRKFNIKTTPSSVEKKVHRLGLKKSKEGIKRTYNRRAISQYWFQNGNVPPLKKEVGDEVSYMEYRYVKVAEPNVWKFKHRWVWEQAHGPIPDDHVIIFLDGDKQNCSLDNLKMISRSELGGISKLPRTSKEITLTNLTIAKIRMKISELERRKYGSKKQVNRSKRSSIRTAGKA